MLRADLLRGVTVALAQASGEPSTGELSGPITDAFTELGASVIGVKPDPLLEEELDDALAAGAKTGRIDLLVLDGAGLFASALEASGDGNHALRGCMDRAWNATRAVVNHAFLRDGEGGRIIYLAPSPQAGPCAQAARAGLENLARTVSVEWARHQITAVAIATGEHSTTRDLSTLVAYLASPAGAYFSGCVLDLNSPQSAAQPADR